MLDRTGKRGSFGVPDADEEVLVVREGQRAWAMSSCIDLFEAGGAVVFAGGVTSRDQKPAVSETDPAEKELKEFRGAWASAKKLLLSGTPMAREDSQVSGLEYVWVGQTPR